MTDPLTGENLRLIASGYSLGDFEDDPGAITDLLLACADRIEADADRVAALTAELEYRKHPGCDWHNRGGNYGYCDGWCDGCKTSRQLYEAWRGGQHRKEQQ